ncbi:MAG: RsmB/NOP family class I SAM-dependent RNA methyltransferase [Bacteroidota bacterium]|nr:RsmB/NOP family class I SAM-dependent RNA methyltransferase [Candidatus Kapabacteria bacterium]MCX7937249.1 RsmB/NOP family class I SAM-dependent RNA methyltransferase [Chlorobiota bacterium]MDW8075738.1 RsmB/NOP family class I SAM-dependent RNA methyltransferase [Bacteroidota bacterium]MDW8272484.1 RsmB/NOP family class I SAM-dependent RNA methyltransferase [Bacteroidota bacterium]
MVTPHLLTELTRALESIVHERRHADRAIERLLRQLPPADERRALIARTIYGVLRHLRRLVWALGQRETFTSDQLADCIRAFWTLENIELPRSLHRGIPPRRELRARWEAAPSRAIRYSVPDWLDRYGEEQCGSRWEQHLAAFAQEPQVVLRTNTLRTTPQQLQALLSQKGIATTAHPLAEEALIVDEYVNVFALEEFHAGLFEMQDAASQAIAHLLDVQPGMQVIDACAGSGGKTLHLAALMRNRGRIIALDTAAWKLDELRRRAARAGTSIIETRPITSTKVIKRLARRADRLLLDLPCTGSGVWRRNPDGKWHLQPDDPASFCKLQRTIIGSYLSMLAPAGKALISTCSIFPEEGERHLDWLRINFPQVTICASGRLDPSEHQCDGFFWAILQTNSETK